MLSTGESVGQRRFMFFLLIGTCLSWPASGLLVKYTMDTPYIVPAIYVTLAVGFWNFVMMGIVLYWIRESSRVLYGGVEVAFALGLLAASIFFHGQPTAARPFMAEASQWFQICAALYVLVRGLDNLGQGLRKYPAWDRRWRWLSLQRLEPSPSEAEEG